MKQSHTLPSAGRIIVLVLLTVFLIGCSQANVQPSTTYTPQEPVGGGCGVSSMEDYTNVDYAEVSEGL